MIINIKKKDFEIGYFRYFETDLLLPILINSTPGILKQFYSAILKTFYSRYFETDLLFPILNSSTPGILKQFYSDILKNL